MRYPNVAQVTILLPILRLTSPTESFPWNDLRKILHGGQGMAKVQNGEEILPEVSNPWVGEGRTDVIDDRRICDSKYLGVTKSRSSKNLAVELYLICS